VESFRRQVPLQRLTPLDRILNKQAANRERFVVRVDPDKPDLRGTAKLREQYLANRLRVLEGIGLARTVAPQMWEMRPDFLTVLRTMQQAGDRQKTLAAHGAQISDDRLTMQVVDIRRFGEVEGRVVAHGENESGKRYTLVEGTDGQVHYFPQTSELEQLRRTGGLSSNTFVWIKKVLGSDQQAVFEVQDLGDAEELLNNKQHFRTVARRLGQGGIPFDVGWKGWLGRYQKKTDLAAEELRMRQEREEVRGGERGR
jgi:hypothetical protein